ncbi:hypothetical protein MA6_gp20 [Pectobacterium phage MA6]|nr:hypothetical protein MA6_gp20 [Pectobacterium phage MA6]
MARRVLRRFVRRFLRLIMVLCTLVSFNIRRINMAKTLSFNFTGTFTVVINSEDEQHFMNKLMTAAKSPEGANDEGRYILVESLKGGPEAAMRALVRKQASKAIRESLLDGGAVRVAPVRVS